MYSVWNAHCFLMPKIISSILLPSKTRLLVSSITDVTDNDGVISKCDDVVAVVLCGMHSWVNSEYNLGLRQQPCEMLDVVKNWPASQDVPT